MQIPNAARAVLESAGLAHLVTLSADGGPHVTVVWCGVDGDDVVTAHLGAYQKVKNVQREPRVALSVETNERSEHGLQRYLVVYGRARVTEGGAAELLQRLAETYIGPGVKFPPMENPPAGYVLRIAVDRIAGVGPWTE